MANEHLTLKQERFIQFYLISGNATQAAIEAGYSPDTAYSIGSENLNKPDIKARIDMERGKEQPLSVADRLRILSEIALTGDRQKTNPVEAIKEYNKLKGDYPPVQHLVASKVQVEVVFVDRKHAQGDLIEGTAIELPSGEDNAAK